MQNIFQKTSTVILLLLLITIVSRFAIASFELEAHYMVYVIMLNILIGAYAGISRSRKASKGESFTFVMDLKSALSVNAAYSLLTAFFTYVYYKVLDPLYFTRTIKQRSEEIRTAGIQEGLNPEEIEKAISNFTEASAYFMDAFNWSSITLFLLVFGSLIYGILLSLFVQKFPKMIQ